MTDQERLMARAKEAWRAAAPGDGEIQRGAARVERRLAARTRSFPRRPILVSLGACAAFLAALAYAGSQKWIEPPRSLPVVPMAVPSAIEVATPAAPPKSNPPEILEPASPRGDDAAKSMIDSEAARAAGPNAPLASASGPVARRETPLPDKPKPSWAEVSDALSGGDEKHAQSLLSDLARRGDSADDRAKAKLGLAQLEASHGNCARARVLALQVAAVQAIELKTVRRALELAAHCTQ